MSRDEATLLDILNAVKQVVAFTAGSQGDRLSEDPKTYAAVLHELIVIGEASKRLSAEFRATHPNIPWKRMAGLRDVLVHQYDDIDAAEVWKVIRVELPVLLEFLKKVVPPPA